MADQTEPRTCAGCACWNHPDAAVHCRVCAGADPACREYVAKEPTPNTEDE